MKNIFQKLNDIQKEITSVHKGARVAVTQNSSYSAVSHDDVAALLHLPMANAGVFVIVDLVDCSITQIVNEKEYQGRIEKKVSYQATVQVKMTFVNSDDPKDTFSVNSFAYAFDSGDKAVGKAESMAVKYAYLKNFNLESVDEEESRDFEQRDYKEVNKAYPAQGKQSTPSSDPATPAQINALKKLIPGRDLTGLTKSEAKKLFDEINAAR